MNYTLLMVYLTSITLLIATPGPVVALVLNTAARGGFRQAVLTVLGTNWASLILIGSAALIISGLFAVADTLLTWISLAGCLFIGWLAIDGLRSEFAAGTDASSQPEVAELRPRTGASAVLHGFLIGISNPKDIVFFVAFFPQFIGITGQFEVSLVVLTLLWILCDFLILLGYAVAMNAGIFQRRKRLISFLSSGFLLFVAIAGFIYAASDLVGRVG